MNEDDKPYIYGKLQDEIDFFDRVSATLSSNNKFDKFKELNEANKAFDKAVKQLKKSGAKVYYAISLPMEKLQ